ncbi:MAG: hypothetical protein ACAI44_38995, partial [Candidatus Sericytochromatia bacterium]
MKCLKCGKNNLYRDRSGGKCSGCGQAFVFEPKSGDVFTDTLFDKALEHASFKDSLSYQPLQLYYELARLRLKKPGAVASKLGATIGTGFAGLLLGVFWTLFWVNAFKFGPGLFVVEGIYLLVWLVILTAVWRKTDPTLITLDKNLFAKGLKKWQAARGQLKGLMDRPLALPHPAKEKDVLDYAVERAIICDHKEVVDFLLANNFHIEQKCAILTYGGYPPERFEAIRAMLRKNPQLHVFVLHNASANGCRIYTDLIHDKEWFPGSKRVFDIGLHPRHAKVFKGLWQKATTQSVLPVPGYSAEEMKWLERYKLELMVVPPAKLLKHLRNVISGQARSIADAYAQGNSDSSGAGGDLILVGDGFDGGDSDFG